jgi:pimeloyl-ACP methyl ester carboxylesterase
MPTVRVNGAQLHYEDTGGAGAPVVFAHGLLFSGRMFDAQVAALKGRHRCIAYDARGHGQSEVTKAGYDMDTACADAAALIEARPRVTSSACRWAASSACAWPRGAPNCCAR